MIALLAYYWYGLLLSLGIGLLTAWLAWGRRPVHEPVEFDPDNEPIVWAPREPVLSQPRPLAAPASFEAAAFQAGGAAARDDDVREDEPAAAGALHGEGAVAPWQAVEVVEVANDVIPADDTDELGPVIAASAGLLPADAPARAAPSAEDGAEVVAEDDGAPDDLTTIKGIGPQLDALLRDLGVTRFEDVAAWMPEDIERIDAALGPFKGRIIRDEWIAQARLLARGDMETFHQRYGHL